MNAAKIENNIVVDIIVIGDPAGLAWAQANLCGEWVDGTGGSIGDRYEHGEFIKPVPPDDAE
jgi:hypothetical protein